MVANDYTLCDSLNLDEENGVCAPAMERHHTENSDVCSYMDPMTEEVVENANAVKLCGYSECGTAHCQVGTGNEIICKIVMQARGFVELVAEYGTNCHKDDGLVCPHGANEGFEENPRDKMN